MAPLTIPTLHPKTFFSRACTPTPDMGPPNSVPFPWTTLTQPRPPSRSSAVVPQPPPKQPSPSQTSRHPQLDHTNSHCQVYAQRPHATCGSNTLCTTCSTYPRWVRSTRIGVCDTTGSEWGWCCCLKFVMSVKYNIMVHGSQKGF